MGKEFVGKGKIILQVPPLKKLWETLLGKGVKKLCSFPINGMDNSEKCLK